MGLNKDKITFDPTDATSNDSIGSYIISSSGNVIDHTTINSDDALDVYAYLRDSSGTAFTGTTSGSDHGLDVNILNKIGVDLDGIYNVSTNADPDNVGIIGHVRAATPDDTNQTFRFTGGAASSDDVVAANVHGLDVNAFAMGYDGATWDRVKATAGAWHVYLDDQNGDLDVNITNTTVAVSETATAFKSTAETVGTTAGEIVSTPLANRTKMIIQNLSGNQIYVGETNGVTTSTGLQIPKNGSLEMLADDSVDVYLIANSGASNDVRVTEFA